MLSELLVDLVQGLDHLQYLDKLLAPNLLFPRIEVVCLHACPLQSEFVPFCALIQYIFSMLHFDCLALPLYLDPPLANHFETGYAVFLAERGFVKRRGWPSHLRPRRLRLYEPQLFF